MAILVFLLILLSCSWLTQAILFPPLEAAHLLTLPQVVVVILLGGLFAWLFGE